MIVDGLRGVAIDNSLVHDFHGSAADPLANGTLRHQDIDLALSQRAQKKVDKYRGGYEAQGLRHAFLPAIVSTSGRIHGELLRLLFILADRKTTLSFQALGEAVDVDSEVYCWRRSGVFWRMRASLGLACAQATTVRFRGMGTGISEASKRVPIFSFAPQGGKQESSHFRQGNWDKTSRLRPGRLEQSLSLG